MIISFAWTTPALLAGAKTMTRREWSATHARRFTVGMLVDAWDRSPRTRKGRKVATIRITRPPHLEWSSDLSEEDVDREGFNWLRAHGEWVQVEQILSAWRAERRFIWVVEFELVERVSSASPAAPPASGEGLHFDNGIRNAS